MGLKFGFGASAGHFLFTKGVQAAGVVLMSGFLRAAYVEAQQQSGHLPEDGRGLAMNTLVYSVENVKDVTRFLIDLNEQTKTSP